MHQDDGIDFYIVIEGNSSCDIHNFSLQLINYKIFEDAIVVEYTMNFYGL